MVDLRDCGKTVLISSHILAELGDLCDSVTVLDRGRVRFSGAIDELPVGDGELGSYELRVLHENEAIGDIVSAVDGVLEVVRLEAATAWRVVCRLGQTDCRQLLGILVERGIVVESFVRQQSRLNEAFLSLTTRGVE
jgi:ABC-2 type transport system ATP-binding protein